MDCQCQRQCQCQPAKTVDDEASCCLTIKTLRRTFPLDVTHFSTDFDFYRDGKERQEKQRGLRPDALGPFELASHSEDDEGGDGEGEAEEVFQLELDWTPVKSNPEKLEPPSPRPTKDAKKERGSLKSRHGGDGAEVLAPVTCLCSRCRSKPAFETRLTGGDAKCSPCESPPSKRVLLSSDTCTTSEKRCALSPVRLLRCDAFYEYAAEAYAAKLLRDDHYWFGCHAALAIQPDLTPGMRKTLLLWLVAVVRQFNFTLETWCITVSLVDRFLAIQPIRLDCLQLAGLSAFFIAAKAEEVKPPEIWELVSLCDYCYDRNQFLWMEYIMLTHLKFEILSPTTTFFLHHQVETAKLQDSWPYELSACLIQLLLSDEWLSNISPSMLASCIFNVVAENWCPKVYVDTDFVEQLMDIIRCAFLV